MTTRPALSRDVIADAGMQLARRHPTTPLTLNRLGVALGADPTALYRHYRNRGELILDLADRSYGDVLDAVPDDPDWRAELMAISLQLRRKMLETPALAAEFGVRYTIGPNEHRLVDRVVGVLERGGVTGDMRLHIRSLGGMVLGHIVMTATVIMQPVAVLAADMAVAAERDGLAHPPDARAYEDLAFEQMMRVYIAGLEHLAHGDAPAG